MNEETHPWQVRYREKRAKPRPSLGDLVGDAVLVASVVILPKWWAVLAVVVLLIGDRVTDRLVFWQRQRIAALRERSDPSGGAS